MQTPKIAVAKKVSYPTKAILKTNDSDKQVGSTPTPEVKLPKKPKIKKPELDTK